MRFVLDRTWTPVGERAVMAGSPPRLFRLTEAGAAVVAAIARGDAVAPSRLVDRLLDAGAIHPHIGVESGHPLAGITDVTVVTPQLGGTVVDDGRITVDDGSEPSLAGAALRLDRNAGPAAGRNAGRRVVDTPFVLFVDADVDIDQLDPTHPDHEGWWAVLLGHFDDPRVGLVAPRVAGDDGSSLDLGAEPAIIRAGSRVSYVPGATLLVRAAAFDDVGGFDPTLRTGEDVDLVWRLDQAGWRCRYEPAATVRHRRRSTRTDRWAQQVKYGSSSGPLALRHPGALAPFRSGGWSAALLAALALGRPFAAAGAFAASVRRLTATAPDFDHATAAAAAGRAHLAAGRQFLAAIRRAWWPILLPFAWSRRVRWLLLGAVAAAPRQVTRDVAFSIGLWRSVVRSRDPGSLLPDVSIHVGGDGRRSGP